MIVMVIDEPQGTLLTEKVPSLLFTTSPTETVTESASSPRKNTMSNVTVPFDWQVIPLALIGTMGTNTTTTGTRSLTQPVAGSRASA